MVCNGFNFRITLQIIMCKQYIALCDLAPMLFLDVRL